VNFGQVENVNQGSKEKIMFNDSNPGGALPRATLQSGISTARISSVMPAGKAGFISGRLQPLESIQPTSDAMSLAEKGDLEEQSNRKP